MAKKKQTEFGIAMRNFTKYPEMPSAQALIDYGVRMEELGYESLWAWDHILLGVEPNFPIHEALIDPDRGRGAHLQDQDRHRHPGACRCAIR